MLSSLSLFYIVQDSSCGVVLCTLREGLSSTSVKLHRWFTMVILSLIKTTTDINHHSVPSHSSLTLPEAGFMISFM